MIPENETDEEYVTRVRLRPIHGRLALCRNEPSLMPYEHLLYGRYQRFEGRLEEIEKNHEPCRRSASRTRSTACIPSPTARRGRAIRGIRAGRQATVPHGRLQRVESVGV